jgi:hypothetical protein
VLFSRNKAKMITPTEALSGREQPAFAVPERHAVLGTPLEPPFPEGLSAAIFGLGCFWGAERKFWQVDGVYTTAVGYAGGFTPNPTYEEVCSGRTAHTEAVLVRFSVALTRKSPRLTGQRSPLSALSVEQRSFHLPVDLTGWQRGHVDQLSVLIGLKDARSPGREVDDLTRLSRYCLVLDADGAFAFG